MNFIEAHKIVHDYAGAVGKGGILCFRPKSYLRNDKDTIIDAYKLFYGHMICFNTRTQEEYEQYEVIRKLLNQFVDDRLYNNIAQNEEILNKANDNLIFKMTNKVKIKEAELNREVYVKTAANILSKEPYRNDEVESFFVAAQKESERIKSNIYKGIKLNELLDLINEYCIAIYDLAGIEMQEYDIDFFYSFDLLRNFLDDKNMRPILSKYADYIIESK